VHNVQEEFTTKNVSISVPIIYVTVENWQAYHQSFVVELEGIIPNQPVSNLIEPSSNLSYISPQVIEECSFHRNKRAREWLVQLATKTKMKVVELIESCPIELDRL
jgi:hypothetical protein